MKRVAAVLIVVCLGLAAVVMLRLPPPATGAVAPDSSSDRLAVHEWGTFTTFSGSDGVRLDFRPLVENDLPDFVFDRPMQAGQSSPFGKFRIRAFVRMETPVTYFYTDRERDVRVRVGFPQGLLTEFYPPVESMAPTFDWAAAAQGEPIGGSLLDWGTVHLIPPGHLRTRVESATVAGRVDRRVVEALVPPVNGHDHYGYARETDSAIVHVQHDREPYRLGPSGSYFEKFLFYRGVGRFDLPLRLESLGEGRYQVTNSGRDPLRSLVLVTVQGTEVRFRTCGDLAGGATRTIDQSANDSNADALGFVIEHALVREGLFEKEARAMVKTWRSSWFGEEGTRLLYLVPRPLTDTLLPLTVEPAPDQIERVLVGRMEILSAEDESRMLDAVRRSAQERAALAEREVGPDETPPVHPFPEELAKLGRLAEPALARLKHIARDASLRAEADLLLRELSAATGSP